MITIDDIGEITSRQREMVRSPKKGQIMYIYSYHHYYSGKTYPCHIGSLTPLSNGHLKRQMVKSINERILNDNT
jgi:hypothetical protein